MSSDSKGKRTAWRGEVANPPPPLSNVTIPPQRNSANNSNSDADGQGVRTIRPTPLDQRTVQHQQCSAEPLIHKNMLQDGKTRSKENENHLTSGNIAQLTDQRCSNTRVNSKALRSRMREREEGAEQYRERYDTG